jgi:membrane-bound ClpP family serine protease
MRVRAVVGILLCITGVIWILQGTNTLHGSGMSGHGEWTLIGAALLIIGVVLLFQAQRMRGRRST